MEDDLEIKTIAVDDAKQKLDQKTAVFVDVRDPDSYQAAHIPGAVLVNDHNVDDFISSADKSQTYILYCYHGISSQGGTAYFEENGFEDVYSMDGGFTEWHHKIGLKLDE